MWQLGLHDIIENYHIYRPVVFTKYGKAIFPYYIFLILLLSIIKILHTFKESIYLYYNNNFWGWGHSSVKKYKGFITLKTHVKNPSVVVDAGNPRAGETEVGGVLVFSSA